MAACSILALVSDAYGGFGGISRFNRDFFNALAEGGGARRIIILPRIITGPIEETLPTTITYDRAAAGGKFAFAMRTLRSAFRENRIDLVVCGHLNLLPLAYIVSRLRGARLYLIIHGIEAWHPHGNPLVNMLARKIDSFLAVSRYSAQRFAAWSRVPESRGLVLPNCVDLNRFRPEPKSAELARRYNLGSSKILMTLGRLVSKDRRKGFDEVIEALPTLIRQHDDIKYLIVGDGDDRGRLERKVRDLGVEDKVVFAGRVPEEEKVAHYNLADLYVMPSAGEGFGIVLIEAAACGVPIIGSSADGSREALLDGRLGTLIDPENGDELVRVIAEALAHPPTRQRNPLIETFSMERFRARARECLAVEFAAPRLVQPE
jgi:phosphatidylinositol alpha-1,6-mannosyltransferase